MGRLYQEIEDYVPKEFGLKVSSLYISKVKRKYGIEVGENYNLPKSENERVSQCSKEDAIKATLKYYAMIEGVTDLMSCHRLAHMNCHQID